jgi:RNA polymerase sigma factor (TIGR02999 family)
MASPPDITALLDDWSRGNHRALDQLLPLVYAELRGIARRQLRRERAGHTLQPTALVHEAYLRLVDQRQVDWRSRAHFFGVAAQVMRRILVDNARRHNAIKRGDGVQCVSIDEAVEKTAPDEISVLARMMRSDVWKASIAASRKLWNCGRLAVSPSKKLHTC